MRYKKDDSKLGFYIVLSVIIHLFIIFFFPFGSLRGVADEGGYGNRNFGFVQFVEVKAPVENKNNKNTKSKKQIEKTDIKEKDKKDVEENETKETKKEEIKKQDNKVDKKSNIDIKENKQTKNNENTTEKQENNENKETKNDATENKEILSSEESEMEIEKEIEKKEEENNSQQENNNVNDKNKNEDKIEEEPPPPPPPTAGELIGLSPKPVYPKYLVSEQETGSVELNAHINQDGIVEKVEILKSSGIETMDRNAILTIKNGWKFKNYKKSYYINIIVDYKIDKKGNTKVDVNVKNVNFK